MIPDIIRLKEQKMSQAKNMHEVTVSKAEIVQDHKREQVQALLGQAFQNILAQNNKILEESVTRAVSDKVTKEVGFLLQAKERQEEERFKKLDSLIRQQQTLRKEAGKSPARKLRRLWAPEKSKKKKHNNICYAVSLFHSSFSNYKSNACDST